MSRSIEYLSDCDIVLVRTSGSYVLNEELATVRAAIAALKKHHCSKCLFDHRQTDVVAETMEAYERSTQYQKIGLEPQMRIASLLREITPDLEFYRNAAVTRGWNVEIFDNFDKALEWLNR